MEWGPGLHFLDALLMGHLPQLAAAGGGEAQMGVMPDSIGRLAEAAPSPEARTRAAQQWEAAREAWAKEHGYAAAGTEMAGTAVPLVAALMGQEYALAPLAARLSALGPRAAQLVNFLRGAAGAERTGATGVAERGASRAVRGVVEGAESLAGEKAAKGQPVTFGDIAKGAALGGTFNPLLRGFMPRAREMGPAEAMLRSIEGLPMHHRGLGGGAAQAAMSVLRRPAEKIGPLGATVTGAGLLTEAMTHPGATMELMKAFPLGVETLGAVALAGGLGAAAERVMARPSYQQRIYQGAMGQGIYPYSRINPLTPFVVSPMTQEGARP